MSKEVTVQDANEPHAKSVRIDDDEIEHANHVKMGIIAQTEVTLGFLLAGIGFHKKDFSNYLIVDKNVTLEQIEHFFIALYTCQNMGIILLEYTISKRIHNVLARCRNSLPIVVIIPSKLSIGEYLEEKERQRRQRDREGVKMSEQMEESGKLIAVIGDEDSCVGFLLGGIGEIDEQHRSNFMVVHKDTKAAEIEACFKQFLARSDVGIILINQIYANMIRASIDAHLLAVPSVLEIPSKGVPYDSSKDSILKRARGMFDTIARKRQ